MESIDCLFRHDVRIDSAGETARCGLLEQVTCTPARESSRIVRAACEACLTHSTDGMLMQHPILSSLLYQHCETALDQSQHQKNDARAELDRLEQLKARAETALRAQSEPLRQSGSLPSCDVIICAGEATSALQEAIESVLAQVDVIPFVHLIDTGQASQVYDRYRQHWNVKRHRLPAQTTLLSGIHAIVDHLHTPFIACQSASGISEPHRLAASIQSLMRHGAEIFAVPIDLDARTKATAPPYRPRTPLATWVLRRATFVDMGGIADGYPDDDVEFFHRALLEHRNIAWGDIAPVRMVSDECIPTVSRAPRYPERRYGTLKSFARGFGRHSFCCDVVLPFHGHLDFVEQAMSSLLQQVDAELVIHLIDDASPEDTGEFLKRWATHANVRTYRNAENIGQFQSFNSVSRFFETEFAAVQDADDISLPHRFHSAGQLFRHGGADYVAGAVELFGDDLVYRPTFRDNDPLTKIARAPIRRSYYPADLVDDYFAENPTAVFRVAMFREVGGFADFGDRLANRASLDTEFQLRCRYHGVRFALSQEIVVRYRVHGDSATQNRLTGWGTAPRKNASRQLTERCRYFRRGRFDPKSFGALLRNLQVTRRV